MKLTILIFTILLLTPLVLSSSVDKFVYNNPKVPVINLDKTTVSSPEINYSLVGVNDSYYHQGLTPQQVADLFDASGYVPYTGASQDIDLGSKNLVTTGNGNFSNITMGNYNTDVVLNLKGKVNSGTGSRIYLGESDATGFFQRYNGSSNLFEIGRRASSVDYTLMSMEQADTTVLIGERIPWTNALGSDAKRLIVSNSEDFARPIALLSGGNPSLAFTVTRTGGGAAFGYIRGSLYNTATDLGRQDATVFGTLGNMQSGTTVPTVSYTYIGTWPNSAYTNSTFRVYSDYVTSLGGFRVSDNVKNYWGTGNDGSIYYDGSNLIINPKEVGSGILDIQGSTNITGDLKQKNGNATINNYYGGMFFSNDTGISISLNETFQSANIFTQSTHDNGFKLIDNEKLQLTDDGGIYQTIWGAEGDGTQNHIYIGYIYVNEERQNNTKGRAVGQASNNVDMTGLGFIRLNKNDNVTLRIADTSGTTAGTIYIANINLLRAGN